MVLIVSLMTSVALGVLSTMLYTQEVLKCILNDLIIHVYNLVQCSTVKSLGYESKQTWI